MKPVDDFIEKHNRDEKRTRIAEYDDNEQEDQAADAGEGEIDFFRCSVVTHDRI